MNKKHSAFTLIELLVVIAIIALLLAIVVPSLKVAKERAMDVICISNIKQYQVAEIMYCNNNENKFANGEDWIYLKFINGSGRFPHDPSNKMNFNCVWHNEGIYPDGTVIQYLGANNVALCPLFARLALSLSRCATDPAAAEHNPNITIKPMFTYSLSAYLGEYSLATNYNIDTAKKTTDVKSPSKVVLFGEENPMVMALGSRPGISKELRSTLNDCLLWPFGPDTAKSSIAGMGGKYGNFVGASFADYFGTFHRAKDSARCRGVSNAVFIDGHVEWVNLEETIKYMWPY